MQDEASYFVKGFLTNQILRPVYHSFIINLFFFF